MTTFAAKTKNSETDSAKSNGIKRKSNDLPADSINISAPLFGFPIQRKADCACGGGCPGCQKKAANLPVSQPHDASEIEADLVADKVMRMSDNKSLSLNQSQIQLKPLSESITPIIQTKNEGGSAINNKLSNKITSSQGSGNKLDGSTQSFMQNRFGTDFSGVKIHTDREAVEMNQKLSAKAFTVENDIYFNQSQYQPNTDSGRHLLAHELTHVVQQNKMSGSFARREKTVQRKSLEEKIAEVILDELVVPGAGNIIISNAKAYVGWVAFGAGLASGFFGGIWNMGKDIYELGSGFIDLVRKVASGAIDDDIQNIYKAVMEFVEQFKADPEKKLKEMFEAIKGAVWGAAKDFYKKWTAEDVGDRWFFRGEIVGMICLEVVLLLLTKGIGNVLNWIAKFAKYAPKLFEFFKKLIHGIDEKTPYSYREKLKDKDRDSDTHKKKPEDRSSDYDPDDKLKPIQKVALINARIMAQEAEEKNTDIDTLMAKLKVLGSTFKVTFEKTPKGDETYVIDMRASKHRVDNFKNKKKDSTKEVEPPDTSQQAEILELFGEGQGKATREGLEADIASQPGMKESAKPGGKPVPEHFDVGNFSHKYAEQLIPKSKLPRGLEAEYKIPEANRRVDRIDWKNRKVYEIKPDTKPQMEAGENQVKLYTHYLNEHFPGDKKWTGEVVTYNKTAVRALLKMWGWIK